jgi:hypothetical protein
MTRVSGYYIKAARCCGARYSMPRYQSVNFMASGQWTDGYREHSLMPNDHGLRRCKCGNFLLKSELITVSEAEETDYPSPHLVTTADLPLAIAHARNPAIETAARLDLWQHLNHAYRDQYRAHREAEDAATEAAWEVANPDPRTTLKKLFKGERKPRYQPALDRPITFPVFEPSPEQRENMLALLDLIGSSSTFGFERVELNRELGRFEEARQNLSSNLEGDSPNLYKLSATLIQQKQAAPVRYTP